MPAEIERVYLIAAAKGDVQTKPALLLVHALRLLTILDHPGPDPIEPEALTRWYGEQNGWSADSIERALLDLRYDIASHARPDNDPVRQLCASIDHLISEANARAAKAALTLIADQPASADRDWLLFHVAKRCRIEPATMVAICDRLRFDRIVAAP